MVDQNHENKAKKIVLFLIIIPIILTFLFSTSYATSNPSITHNSQTQLAPHWFPRTYPDVLNISCTVSDDVGILNVVLEENSTGTIMARSMELDTPTLYFYGLNTSILGNVVLAYRFVATDTDFLPHTTTSPWYYMRLDKVGPEMPFHYLIPSVVTYEDAVNISGDFHDVNEIASASLVWSVDNWMTNYSIEMPIYRVVYYWRSLAKTETAIPAHPTGTRVDFAITVLDRVNSSAIHYSHYIVDDLTPPNITDVSYPPSIVQVNETIILNVTITEPSWASGISETYLRYYPDSEVMSFYVIPLTLVANGQYQAVLPTSVGVENATITIVAKDNASNIYVESFFYSVAGPIPITPSPIETAFAWGWWSLLIAIVGIVALGFVVKFRGSVERRPIEPEILPKSHPKQEAPQTKRYCKRCGEEAVPNATFCSNCGSSLEKYKFCPECGRLLEEE
jgi:hypothetical protein